MTVLKAAFVWCALFIGIGLLGGCTTQTSDKVLKPISVVDSQQLVQDRKKLLGLAGTSTGVYVDCRPETEYRAGHIPGAVNLPYERVSLDHKPLLKYDVLIVYGRDYNDSLAIGMSKRLVELGHSDVRTLIGGMRAWKADGREIETGE